MTTISPPAWPLCLTGLFLGQNTQHVDANAAIGWRVDELDLLVAPRQRLGQLMAS